MVPLSEGPGPDRQQNINYNYPIPNMEKLISAPAGPFTRIPAFLLVASILLFQSALNAQSGLWSDPATWGGSLPAAGSTVIINPGQTVILDMDPPALKGIQVRGNLMFADQDINLSTGYILVTGGEFRIGTESAPYDHKAVITFTGDIHDVTGMGLGNKFLMVMGGGKLELHGSRAAVQSWTQLRKPAAEGHVIIETEEAMNWRVGDQIVIAPSGTDANQTEVRTISMISGHQIRVTPPLTFKHYGRIDTVSGYAIDMRAEVGLLTRDIVLQGDNSSEYSKNGGHVMIMNGSIGRVEGVEFYRMGWFGEQGRYPMHWHLSGDGFGEYARNNSIHRSYHRGIVVHGTNGVRVTDNVAYDVFSHCYVIAEDGNEEENVFIGNLGLLTKRIPDMSDFAFPGGQFGSTQSERHPGTFWQMNPNNIVRNNHAAGSIDGIGFFYDETGTASSVPDDFFSGNVAHSNWSSEGSYDRAHYRTTGWGLFVGAGLGEEHPMVFTGFTGYKNTMGGAWLDGLGVLLRNSVLADNGGGVNIQGAGISQVGLIHRSPNQIKNTDKNIGAINIFTSFDHGNKEPKILDVDVIGFDKRIRIETEAVDIYSYARNIEFIGGSGPKIVIDKNEFQGAFIDRKGLVSGSGDPMIYFGRDYDFTTSTCTLDGAANARKCSARDYNNLKIYSDYYDADPVGDIRLTRSGGVTENMFESEVIGDWLPEYGHRQIQWIPSGEAFQVSFTSEPMPNEFFVKMHGLASSGSRLIFTVPSGKMPRVIRTDGTMMPAAPSIADLNYAEDGWFFDEADNRFYLSMNMSSADDLQEELKIKLVPARLASTEELASASLQLMPNPFSRQLILNIPVSQDQVSTSIRLFQADGQQVFDLTNQVFSPGIQTVTIDGSSLAPGTYLYEVRTGSRVFSGSVVRIQE